MSDVASPHDRYFRETFSRAEAARDLVSAYLPPEVVGCLDVGTLEVTGDTFVDPELRLHVSDLVCRVARRGGGEAYVYVLFEHKSRPDRWVALQLLRYMTRVCEAALREGQKPPLPAVIPVVFYHGRARWTVERDFGALVRAPEALAPYVPDFQYVLVDLSARSDEEIRGDVLVRVALLAMRHVFAADLPERLAGIVRLLDTVVRTPSGLGALEALLRYIASAGKGVGEQEVRDAVREALSRFARRTRGRPSGSASAGQEGGRSGGSPRGPAGAVRGRAGRRDGVRRDPIGCGDPAGPSSEGGHGGFHGGVRGGDGAELR